jgi:hypothetical protein
MIRSPMHSPSFRLVMPRRFAWLLWLALLLPVAQAAAACHALSHVGGSTQGESGGKQAPHGGHCDLCLAAAAIAGGAAVTAPPAFVLPSLEHALPQERFAGVLRALPTPAYLSRAPPIASS